MARGLRGGCGGPFRGYSRALVDRLPDAIVVVDHFHAIPWPTPAWYAAARSKTLSATAAERTTRSTASASGCSWPTIGSANAAAKRIVDLYLIGAELRSWPNSNYVLSGTATDVADVSEPDGATTVASCTAL